MKTKKEDKPKQLVSTTLRRIFAEHAEFKRPIIVLVLLNVGMAVCSAVSPLFIAKIINALAEHQPLTEVLTHLASFAGIGAVGIAFMFAAYNHETKRLDWQRSNALVNRTMKHLLSLTVGQLRNEHSGVRLSKVGRGQSAVRQLFDGIVQQLVPTALFGFGACIAMSIAYPVVGLVTTFCCVGITFLTVRAAKLTHKTRKHMSQYESSRVDPANSDLTQHMPSIILAAESERSLARLNAVRGAAARNHRGFYLPLGRLILPLWVCDLVTRTVAMGLTVWFIHRGLYQVGALVAVVTWLMQSVGRLRDLQHLLRGMLQLWADSLIFFEMMDTKPTFETPPHAITFDELEGNIVFDGVVFQHGGSDAPALSGVSFSIPAGSTVGIVGPSGAGKSTILSLLLAAVQPTMGRILIDGVDIRDVNLERLRELIGFVEQEPLVLDRSLRENLLFGLPEERRQRLLKDSTELEQVLDSVGLSKLKSRLTHRMGEVGRKLSGGEKQRVVIARTALKNPSLLIIDEGTSAVDPETEQLVHQLLRDISRGSTRIFVAHRLATVQHADLILVLDKGQLVASGTHNELLERSPLYQRLVKGQLLRTV